MTSHEQYVDHRGNPRPIFAYFRKKIFILGYFHFVKKKKKTPLRKEYFLNSHNSFIQLALEEFQAVAKTQDDTQVQSTSECETPSRAAQDLDTNQSIS